MCVELKKTIKSSNFARYVLEDNHNVNFEINKSLEYLKIYLY